MCSLVLNLEEYKYICSITSQHNVPVSIKFLYNYNKANIFLSNSLKKKDFFRQFAYKINKVILLLRVC